MLLGLRTAIYPVTDLEAARNWYTQLLGHPPYFDEPFYVGFEVGGFELGLVPDGEPGLPALSPLWGVGDADQAMSRLLELGATRLEDVHDVAATSGRRRARSVRESVRLHREPALLSNQGAVVLALHVADTERLSLHDLALTDAAFVLELGKRPRLAPQYRRPRSACM